jgi:hypothetical protein
MARVSCQKKKKGNIHLVDMHMRLSVNGILKDVFKKGDS